jgi:Ni/Fe-hydrogenase 1 B-type cytochrome subunit
VSALPRFVPERPGAGVMYVWELPVRVTHWLIVLSIAVLAVTGYYIGDPFIAVSGRARDHFVMGTIRVIHLYAAIVFTLSVLVRVYWMFAGNYYAGWRQFVPVTRERLSSTWQALRFYGFVRDEPPPYPGHSGLAALAYAAIFLIYFAMIGTGLALYTVYAPAQSVFQGFRFLIPIFRGLQNARFIHHIGMWLLLIFMIHHVYSAILFSLRQRMEIIESMFSGYKHVSSQAVAEGERDA